MTFGMNRRSARCLLKNITAGSTRLNGMILSIGNIRKSARCSRSSTICFNLSKAVRRLPVQAYGRHAEDETEKLPGEIAILPGSFSIDLPFGFFHLRMKLIQGESVKLLEACALQGD